MQNVMAALRECLIDCHPVNCDIAGKSGDGESVAIVTDASPGDYLATESICVAITVCVENNLIAVPVRNSLSQQSPRLDAGWITALYNCWTFGELIGHPGLVGHGEGRLAGPMGMGVWDCCAYA